MSIYKYIYIYIYYMRSNECARYVFIVFLVLSTRLLLNLFELGVLSPPGRTLQVCALEHGVIVAFLAF